MHILVYVASVSWRMRSLLSVLRFANYMVSPCRCNLLYAGSWLRESVPGALAKPDWSGALLQAALRL